MEVLPDDILLYIYKLKHELEINDILKDIKTIYNNKFTDACSLLKFGYINDDYDKGLLYSAMRNEGYIDRECLSNELRRLKLMNRDKIELEKNCEVLVKTILKEYAQKLPNARVQYNVYTIYNEKQKNQNE